MVVICWLDSLVLVHNKYHPRDLACRLLPLVKPSGSFTIYAEQLEVGELAEIAGVMLLVD